MTEKLEDVSIPPYVLAEHPYRHLDFEAAKEVMGWRLVGFNAHHATPQWTNVANDENCYGSGYFGGGFSPSTQVDSAWELILKLKKLAGDSRSDLWHHFTVSLGFDIDKHEPDEMWGMSPLRITQAALAAVRVGK